MRVEIWREMCQLKIALLENVKMVWFFHLKQRIQFLRKNGVSTDILEAFRETFRWELYFLLKLHFVSINIHIIDK